jgi:uncharacterized protein YjiK
MKGIQVFITFLVILCFTGCYRRQQGSQTTVSDLELVAVLPVDMPAALEPSGLTEYNGELYTVADKDNQTIYKVAYDGNQAALVPAVRFNAPRHWGLLDWEGVTADQSGNFYLISEKLGRLYKVTPEGEGDWISPDLRDEARGLGLFTKSNAGFEGIARIADNQFIGAAEREPRGLVEFTVSGDSVTCFPHVMEYSSYSNRLNFLRIPDYSGMDTENGQIYALFRNAHLVVRLHKTESGYEEAEAWSYQHLETDPRWAYIEQTFGQAEGLVVRGREVFLIMDNNLGGRKSDPGDGRSMLIHARMVD